MRCRCSGSARELRNQDVAARRTHSLVESMSDKQSASASAANALHGAIEPPVFLVDPPRQRGMFGRGRFDLGGGRLAFGEARDAILLDGAALERGVLGYDPA